MCPGNKAEESELLQLIADVVSPTDDPRQQIGGTIDTTLYKNLRILCPFVGLMIYYSTPVIINLSNV